METNRERDLRVQVLISWQLQMEMALQTNQDSKSYEEWLNALGYGDDEATDNQARASEPDDGVPW